MPKFLEERLKKEYGEDSDVPYKIMNKLGYMRGNKETPKGRAAEAKHEVKNPKVHGELEKDTEFKAVKKASLHQGKLDDKNLGLKMADKFIKFPKR